MIPTRRHVRMHRLAEAVEKLQGVLSDAEREALVSALKKIADGTDANVALDVKMGPGESPDKLAMRHKLNVGITLVAAARRPIQDDGLGLSLSDALDHVSEHLGVSPGTLLREWQRKTNARLKSDAFKLDDLLPD